MCSEEMSTGIARNSPVSVALCSIGVWLRPSVEVGEHQSSCTSGPMKLLNGIRRPPADSKQ